MPAMVEAGEGLTNNRRPYLVVNESDFPVAWGPSERIAELVAEKLALGKPGYSYWVQELQTDGTYRDVSEWQA